MEYAKKLVYLSNQWYNDGLKKANIRDLSGAIISLKKSLQYNRDNIASRNLLGLVYYGRGEVAEALVEWIISKNIKSHGNIADYYMKKVQEAKSELEVIDQAVQKYNQCLVYCAQNGEDLAAIQLKKVIAAHPSFLKAYQLLALLYLQTEQYAKARQLIQKAHRMDTTNETTLRYMHELKQLHRDKAVKLKTERAQTVSYNLGNETIIQPVSSTLKDNATLLTILNIGIGLVVGMALVWLLVVPTVRKNMNANTNKDIIVYSEQIAALETELKFREKELGEYQAASADTEAQKEIAQGTQSSYEALVDALENFYAGDYKRATLVDKLLLVKTQSLGEVGLESFQAVAKQIYPAECEELYLAAEESFAVANYTRVIEKLERVVLIEEKYKDGEALFMLMQAYQKKNDMEKATTKYNRILELFPDTELAQKATEKMDIQQEQ